MRPFSFNDICIALYVYHFLSVLMLLDICVPTVLSDNAPFVESIFNPIFYLPGAGISDFLFKSSKNAKNVQ